MLAQSGEDTRLPRFEPVGDHALLVTFARQIDLVANRQAQALAYALRQALADQALPGLGEAVSGYATLLVHYDSLLLDYALVEAFVRRLSSRRVSSHGVSSHGVSPRDEVLGTPSQLLEIPVIYGGEAGPDLAFVADYTGLSETEVVRIHSGHDYPVFMMGFTPGFPYLGGMDPAIAAPRLSTPRARVPGGSVGIAGEQTGIYPLDSPGGWRIIGRTQIQLFNPGREPPFLIAPGDRLRFVPVSIMGIHP
jgi:KipI family sensor histidine kinase inhibitor